MEVVEMRATCRWKDDLIQSAAFERLPVDDVVRGALREFVARLEEAEGNDLLCVVLFGSMARGDHDDESDTDVFVLLREGADACRRTWDVADVAYDAAFDVCFSGPEPLPFVLISPFVETLDSLSQEQDGSPRWRSEPILDEIRKNGIPLFDRGPFTEERLCLA